jgi:two-component sensor histidine kinase
MMKEGLITMSFKDAWRYQQGDDRQWANPNFDDAAWHNIAPEGLRANAMPDSLWYGYGWWRMRFTADSTFYSTVSRLHFRGWGAAEVYLDGKKISYYGTFSTDAATEKNYVPRYVVDKTISVEPAALHVLAIRYSNHQAKRNRDILKHNAPYLGFTFGFANESKGAASERNYAYYIIAHSIVAAILLLLFLLHLLLFFKFPKDKSNLAISLVVLLFLMSAGTNCAGLFMEVTAFSNTILRGFVNSACYGLGLVLLPYTLSLLFRLDKFNWTKHLLWLVLVRSLIYFFPIIPIIACDSTFIVIILVSIGIVMYHAIKSKKPGVHYVTAGAIGTTIFIMIDRLFATNVIGLSDESFYTVLVFSFICFPVGLSVYITSRYGSLFSSMEREVSFRTFELNKTVEELKSAQVLLAAKNAENELLLKEIHHRVKNNLEIVSSLLQLQTAQFDDPAIQSAMLTSQNRVHSMGIIHQKLYQGQHLAAVEMRDYFINLSESILDSFSAEGRIKIECNMPQLILDVDTAISIGLITNELITNSLKYAFTDKAHGEIKISLVEEKNVENMAFGDIPNTFGTEGVLLLKISDDGIGKPVENKAKGTGFGSQLIALLTKQLDGQLKYEVNHGTIVSLAFKKPKMRSNTEGVLS